MKRYTWLGSILLLALAVLVSSCQNPLTSSLAAQKVGEKQGVISISISPVSPVVTDFFKAQVNSKGFSTPKAYLAANRLHFKLMAGTTVVSEWDETLSANFWISMVNGTSLMFPASNHDVPVGSYTLVVQVFNTITDPNNPVVQGTSAQFSVVSAQTTNVSVTCLPVLIEATVNAKNVFTPATQMQSIWVFNTNTNPPTITVGPEKWYKVVVNQSTTNKQFTLAPTAGSGARVGFLLYDGQGNYIDSNGGQNPGDPVVLIEPTTAGGTYYMGVIEYRMDDGTVYVPPAIRQFQVSYSDAPPMNLRVSDANTSYITLSWDAAPGAMGYEIYRAATQTGPYTWIGSVTSASTSFTNSGLANQSIWYYKVSADYADGPSPLSASVMGQARLSVPPLPNAPMISNILATSVNVSWAPVATATYYNVYRDTMPSGVTNTTVYNGTGTSFIDSPLTPQTTYYYWVEAGNSMGGSGWSAYSMVTTSGLPVPDMPMYGLLVSSPTVNSLYVSWEYVPNATSYNVFRDTYAYGTYSTQVYFGGTANFFTDTNLASGTTYYYKVQANNSSGSSPLSNWFSGTTQAVATTPTGLVISSTTASSVTISWNAFPGALSYDVYYYDGWNNNTYVNVGTSTSFTQPVTQDVNWTFWVRANTSSTTTDWSQNISYMRVYFANQATRTVTFYQPFTSGYYNVKWADTYSGNVNNTEGVDVLLSMFKQSDGTAVFQGWDSGYYSPQYAYLFGGEQYRFEVSIYGGGVGTGSFELWYYPAN